MAEAQTLAIRKYLSKAAFDSNISPGPPLPASHPSPNFIAKLHLECLSFYTSAKSLAKATGGSDISTELRNYLTDRIAFHAALAHKWLGVDAGENGGLDKAGEAVGYLGWAKKELEDLKEGSLLQFVRGDKEKEKKSQILEELESTTTFYKYYKKANDSVCYRHFKNCISLILLLSYISSLFLVRQNYKLAFLRDAESLSYDLTLLPHQRLVLGHRMIYSGRLRCLTLMIKNHTRVHPRLARAPVHLRRQVMLEQEATINEILDV